MEDSLEESTQSEDTILRDVESNLMNTLTLGGIPNIRRVYITEQRVSRVNKDTKVIEMVTENVLETDGINMREVMAVEEVDFATLYSNAPVEVYNVLGIEATRNALLKELRKVIEFDGSYVNYRHLSLLADVMCQKGGLMSITRHGINRREGGVLARSSFEETVEILLEAAGSGETDICRGVSENIILGQLAPLGTGEFDVLLDEQVLEANARSGPGLQYMGNFFNDISGGSKTPDHRTPMSPSGTQFYQASPSGPQYDNFAEPQFSPIGADSGRESGRWTPSRSGAYSPFGGTPGTPGAYTPGYVPTSPGYSPTSPGYS
ncbi:DNA-directed RNA polymerase II subunit rpb1, partial [Gonapodya sp. JEL0774]